MRIGENGNAYLYDPNNSNGEFQVHNTTDKNGDKTFWDVWSYFNNCYTFKDIQGVYLRQVRIMIAAKDTDLVTVTQNLPTQDEMNNIALRGIFDSGRELHSIIRTAVQKDLDATSLLLD